MSQTPRTRSSHRKATTPGSASSVGSVASAASSTGSYKPGVSWPIQKALAVELEAAFPLASGHNPIVALNNTGSQAFSKFLDALVAKDTEDDTYYGDLFGKRGDPVRNKLRDLSNYWKGKSVDNYARTVLLKLNVQQQPSRTPRATPTPNKKVVVEEQESDLSSDEEEQIVPQNIFVGKQETKKLAIVKQTAGEETAGRKMSSRPMMELAPQSVAKAAGVDQVGKCSVSLLLPVGINPLI